MAASLLAGEGQPPSPSPRVTGWMSTMWPKCQHPSPDQRAGSDVAGVCLCWIAPCFQPVLARGYAGLSCKHEAQVAGPCCCRAHRTTARGAAVPSARSCHTRPSRHTGSVIPSARRTQQGRAASAGCARGRFPSWAGPIPAVGGVGPELGWTLKNSSLLG